MKPPWRMPSAAHCGAKACPCRARPFLWRSSMPEISMPKMGDSMEEGTIVRWLKREGDAVAEEEPIAEIQTEKANIEINAYQAGTLTRILVPEGQTVPVGAPIAVVDGGTGSAAVSAPARSASTPAANSAEAAPAAERQAPPAEQKPPPPTRAPEEGAVPPARA